MFIISQGASKFLYYVGAFWLFFLPAAHITKGGMAGMLAPLYAPHGNALYYTAVALIALCGVLSFILLLGYARVAVWLVARIDYRYISVAALIVLVALVVWLTGVGGLAIMLVATPIGAMPVLWGSRRMNCLGVLLVPITLNLAGFGSRVRSLARLALTRSLTHERHFSLFNRCCRWHFFPGRSSSRGCWLLHLGLGRHRRALA